MPSNRTSLLLGPCLVLGSLALLSAHAAEKDMVAKGEVLGDHAR